MQLFRHKNFTKQYKKLGSTQQTRVNEAISLFTQNPFHLKLRNHSLKGKYQGYNSIDAAPDLRIIFKQEQNYVIIILLKVGSHSQLY